MKTAFTKISKLKLDVKKLNKTVKGKNLIFEIRHIKKLDEEIGTLKYGLVDAEKESSMLREK